MSCKTPKIPNFTARLWLSEQQSDDMRAEVNYRFRPPSCMLDNVFTLIPSVTASTYQQILLQTSLAHSGSEIQGAAESISLSLTLLISI